MIIQTDPSSSFVCDYVAGVNRVLSLAPYLLVDNIGRNFEMWRFARGDREPETRSLCDFTSYPDDPMAALLDLDIHAAFLRDAGRELVTVNHYGRVRAFALPGHGRMLPVWEQQLLGDAERVVMAGDCFIASSPRGEFTDDPAQPGLFLFAPIAPRTRATLDPLERLAHEQALAEWGVISALAVNASANRLAVAAGSRLGVFALPHDRSGAALGDCLVDATLTAHGQWLHFDDADRLWVGGPDRVDDDCRGGAIEILDAERGSPRFVAALPDATAWGDGADPLVLMPGARALYAIGRDASLHAIDVSSGQSHVRSAGQDGPSLGIGHAALRDGWIYAGFSRGGFQLWRYAV